ncbi:MAG TPA: sulfide/dihydroorotate dehydrogenase-like FAD/NAD-binding protein [Firmicutes bacterium]|nr:sulfide/dihydroorotate dehydrogenase-like FAD/NAD-binding protein [Bacillota bacterium]
MFPILNKELLAPAIYRLRVRAPLIAQRARAGNFVILRLDETSERIPITIAGHDPRAGTLDLVIQAVGKSTEDLCSLKPGAALRDVLGPLGEAVEVRGEKNVIGICGGIGAAPILPVLKAYHAQGARITTIFGARSADLFVLKEELRAISDQLIYTTDDGSLGRRGLVTEPLEELLQRGQIFDRAVAIGPAPMMRAVCKVTEKYALPTIVSLNAIMIDGTGMCGGCRVTVAGETKFTCVEGPCFDGHRVDFDSLILRQAFYRQQEQEAVQTRGAER